MNLIAQAEADLSFTLEDNLNGFGVALQFQNNNKSYVNLICQTTDIGFFQDMNTGEGILGRTVEVNYRISSADVLNIPYPTKQTVLKYVSTLGDESKLRVQNIMPDRKLGIIKLTLEMAKNGG